MRPILLVLLLATAPLASQTPEDETAVWSTWGGEVRLELRADYLPDFGLEIRFSGEPRSERLSARMPVRDLGSITLYAPAGNFERFLDGRLDVSSTLSLGHGSREVALDHLVLTPGMRGVHPVLEVHDGGGRHLLTLSHLHVNADSLGGRLAIANADVEASAELAELLGMEVLSGLPLGMAWLDLNLRVPEGADLSGHSDSGGTRELSCAGRPFWPQDGHEIDVTLIAMGTVAYQGTAPDGRIKVAPSATLRNESQGDVPWIEKFKELEHSEYDYPFKPPDQHPYLVWNLYRVHDGRIEQLAASGAKHAFNTINVACTQNDGVNCGSNQILWPGCEDIYASQTNDLNQHQGPRSEILAAEGFFLSACSFFDPDCEGEQTLNSGTFENRLLVDPAELETKGADYFMDSWYVIQYDIDIWNSMGYRRLSPASSGSGWSFGPLGLFVQGPAIGEWVDEGAGTGTGDHRVLIVPPVSPDAPYPDNMPQGHLRVAVRVSELQPGRFRYNYAVMNYDLDIGVDRIFIPVRTGAEIFEIRMGGPADVLAETWTITPADDGIEFTPPDGSFLPWFTLYNFEVETDAVPMADGRMVAGVRNGTPDALHFAMLAPGPGPEVIFADQFGP